jgi:hypothetical protein
MMMMMTMMMIDDDDDDSLEVWSNVRVGGDMLKPIKTSYFPQLMVFD